MARNDRGSIDKYIGVPFCCFLFVQKKPGNDLFSHAYSERNTDIAQKIDVYKRQ